MGAEIDPGMALTPLPSSIVWGTNPRPSDHEASALPLDHSFRLTVIFTFCINYKELIGFKIVQWIKLRSVKNHLFSEKTRNSFLIILSYFEILCILHRKHMS